MKTNNEVTWEEASRRFSYCPETGALVSKIKQQGRLKGQVIKPERPQVMIDGVQYRQARLCWFLHYKTWPKGVVDHINRRDYDHRIINLRDATVAENAQNKKVFNPHGFKGVTKDRKPGLTKPYKANIEANGKLYFLGCFYTAAEAGEAYVAAALRLHGEFAQVDAFR